MNRIARYTIVNLEIHAPIGWFKEEQENGNVFLVNISYDAPFKKAAESDNLSDAVNYGDICKTIEVCFQKKCRLLEQISLHVVSSLNQQFPDISNLEVNITKMHPPVEQKVEGISISIKG